MGGIYCAASFLSITASDLSDQLLKDFLDMDSSQIVTMHIQSVDQNRAIKTVKRTITELDRSKIEEQKKAIVPGMTLTSFRRIWNLWQRCKSSAEGIAEPERANVPCYLSGAEHRAHGTGTGKQRFSGIQHCTEAQLQPVPP